MESCKRILGWLAVAACLSTTVACEDGPEGIFSELEEDPQGANGHSDSDSFTETGDTSFDEEQGGDSIGTAKFCDESESTEIVKEMVVKPIVPDVSAGGVPLWDAEGNPVQADDLLGKAADGKFCDATGVYANAFTWGPTNEIIVFFDQETRLVTNIQLTQQYLGSLEGDSNAGGTKQKVVIKPRERITIGSKELDEYAGSGEQESKSGSWLNHKNINAMYSMIRETFFEAEPPAKDFDCVAAKICDVIYTGVDETAAQTTAIVFRDSGVFIQFNPDGTVQVVDIELVRVAPFEIAAQIELGNAEIAPAFASASREGCDFTLSEAVSWEDFKSRCIMQERTLARVNYDVGTSRGTVAVEFNGITLGFTRDLPKDAPLTDGEAPAAGDRMYEIAFTRSLTAPVKEFVPATLVALYKTKLEAHLKAAAGVQPPAPPVPESDAGAPMPDAGAPMPDAGGAMPTDAGGTSTMADAMTRRPPDDHPFALWTLELPDGLFATEPTRIEELTTVTGQSFIPVVISQLTGIYENMTPEQQARVTPRFEDAEFLIEPFVDAVMSAFTYGASDAPTAFKAFRSTDDHRWSIGYANFLAADGVPHRVIVQYSLNFGAVTSVSVSRGWNATDEALNSINASLQAQLIEDVASRTPYYLLALSQAGFTSINPLSLGSAGITVGEFDSRLNLFDINLQAFSGTGTATSVALTVPGESRANDSGYFRQLQGERFEFVAADKVTLPGLETYLTVYVEADGSIGRVEHGIYKGSIGLCSGLQLRIGMNVRDAITAWHAAVGDAAYRDCDLVFNYSENGNVLQSVASLSNRTGVSTDADRALIGYLWK